MSVWTYISDFFSHLHTDFINWLEGFGLSSGLVSFIDAIVGIIWLLILVFPVVMLFTLLERKGIGRFQLRPGPNRAGPGSIFLPILDFIKLITKEDFVPARGDKVVHWLAAVLMFVPTLLFFAVVPVGAQAIYADINIGILYLIAIGTLGLIAVFMAGWASNNKYALIGAMRGVAQLISYEVPMVLAVVGVVLVVGSLKISDIVNTQQVPFILIMPLGFLIYFLGATAELNRAPMDLLEADQEIVAGYHIEYSGMRFGLFFVAEFGNLFASAAIITAVFLAGWKGPLLPAWMWFFIKAFGVYFVLLWMRATLPRLRVDQLMGFAWKFMVPLALINLFVIGAEVLIWDKWMAGWERFPWPFLFLNFALAGVLIFAWSRLFFKFGGGRVDVREVGSGYSQGYGDNVQAPAP